MDRLDKVLPVSGFEGCQRINVLSVTVLTGCGQIPSNSGRMIHMRMRKNLLKKEKRRHEKKIKEP